MTSFLLSLLVALSASAVIARALGQQFRFVLLFILVLFCARLSKVQANIQEHQHQQYLQTIESCCND
jgi:hypothetical protein